MKKAIKLKSFSLIITTLCLTSSVFAKGVSSKSMLISIAVPVVAGVYSYTIDDVEGLKELGLSSLVTAHATTLLKYTVDRKRPNGDDRYSFPSGHASASFLGASYLHHRYGLAWGLPMYGVASAVAVQRVNVKDHFWSDVIAGAAIGYFTAAFFTVKYPEIWLKPYASPNQRTIGLQFETRFH